MSYEGDSFFTLSVPGQIGLAVLSLILAAPLIALARWLRRTLPRPLWMPLAIALFWGFVWLSPQVFYTYYRLILPDLPAQIVVGKAPSLATIAALASFTDKPTLSEHGKGVLFWLLVATTLWPPRKDPAHAP